MFENTALTRQVALLSIIAMAGVALSSGVAAADHQVEDTTVELSAPDSVETGEEFDVEASVPEEFETLAIQVELETSEGSATKSIVFRRGSYQKHTVSTDGLGLGQAPGEAEVTAQSWFGPNAEVFATETVELVEPDEKTEPSVPAWAQYLPEWFINYLKSVGYF